MRLRGPIGRWLLDAPAHWPCWYDVVIEHCVYLTEDAVDGVSFGRSFRYLNNLRIQFRDSELAASLVGTLATR
jgi:hypothetical protein